MISAKMRRTGHSSYSITRDRGAPEVADSGGRWAGGASPPLAVPAVARKNCRGCEAAVGVANLRTMLQHCDCASE